MIRKAIITAAVVVGAIAGTGVAATAATLPIRPIHVVYCVVKTFEGTAQSGSICYTTKAQATTAATVYNTVVARQCAALPVRWVCDRAAVVVPKLV